MAFCSFVCMNISSQLLRSGLTHHGQTFSFQVSVQSDFCSLFKLSANNKKYFRFFFYRAEVIITLSRAIFNTELGIQHACSTHVAHIELPACSLVLCMLPPHFVPMISVRLAVCQSLFFLGLLILGRGERGSFHIWNELSRSLLLLRKPVPVLKWPRLCWSSYP